MSAQISGPMARVRRLSVALCACLALAAVFAAGPGLAAGGGGAPPSAVDRSWQFDIPPQDLSTALQRWSAVTGIDWGYVGANLVGVPSRGVTGKVTAAEALKQLLSGTGFSYAVLPNGSITIVRDETDERAEPAEVAA